VLEPDPVDGFVARAEYEVWRAALNVLVEDLKPVLVDHIPVASERPWRPWEQGEAPAPRIFLSGGEKIARRNP